jgi:hypothetical protein
LNSCESRPLDRPAVPDWLVGLWQRESLRFADGTTDRTTRVFWGQTSSLYVDIRVPADRPIGKDRKSLGEFTLCELRLMAEQKGFAGHITLNDGRCSWIRYMDYRPSTGRTDEGRLRLDGDILYEEGDPAAVLGKSYQEIYRRKSRAEDLCVALRRRAATSPESKRANERDAILILLDNWFLYALARQLELPPAETLGELVDQANGDREKIHGYLDCEYSLGQIRGLDRSWQVQLSTLPHREGAALFDLGHADGDDTTLVLTHANSKQASYWEIVESNISSDKLASMFSPVEPPTPI